MLLGNSLINLSSKCMSKMALGSQPTLYSHNLMRFFFADYPQHELIQMPSLSPTMKDGNIAKWLKKVGDKVEPGDFLMEVETDKATVGYEMQESGYIAKILLPEGAKNIQLGTDLAVLVQDKSMVEKFKDYKPGEAASAPAATTTEQPQKEEPKAAAPAPAAQPTGKTYPSHELYELPSLSPTMKTGKLVKWDKKEGDKISVGEVICEIETDKAVVGFETQEDGFIAKILMQDGETGEIGRPIAVVVSKEELVKEFKDFVVGAAAAAAPVQEQPAQENKASEEKSAAPAVQQQQKSGDRVFISPLAKKVALENKIMIDTLAGKGTGANGRVIESDILKEIERLKEIAAKPTISKEEPKKASETIAPLLNNPYKDTPNSQMRQIIAERLTSSKQQIPHYYLSIDVRMDNALKLREELNLENKVKISVNDMIVKATALACMEIPECNSQWGGDYIRQYQNCDVSVAVSTESGLITPIVFEANKLGFKQISEQTKKLAAKARERKLLPEEFQGGTITVSNLGMFGIDQFIGVVNPPQACLLALGRTKKKIIANELAITPQDPAFKIVSEMTAYLSLDHRVVDGSVGAKWLQSFKKFLEKPNTMLL